MTTFECYNCTVFEFTIFDYLIDPEILLDSSHAPMAPSLIFLFDSKLWSERCEAEIHMVLELIQVFVSSICLFDFVQL